MKNDTGRPRKLAFQGAGRAVKKENVDVPAGCRRTTAISPKYCQNSRTLAQRAKRDQILRGLPRQGAHSI